MAHHAAINARGGAQLNTCQHQRRGHQHQAEIHPPAGPTQSDTAHSQRAVRYWAQHELVW